MGARIKRIDIRAFRGVPDLQLDLEGKNLVLSGDNGTGKSSIVEALEFFFTGRVAHLEGVQGLSMQRHAPHVRFGQDDVRVEVVFDPGNVSVFRTFDSPPCPPSHLKALFEVAQNGTFVLRRCQILEFIESRPADRFRAIGSILGIEALDEVELQMMRVRDDFRGRVSAAEAQADRLKRELSDLLHSDVAQSEDVVSALNQELESVKLPVIGSLKEVAEHAERMLSTVKGAETVDKSVSLAQTLESAESALIPQDLVDDITALSQQQGVLLRDNVRLQLWMAGLLETGLKLIRATALDGCPLCEQPIDRATTLSRLEARIRTLSGLSDQASDVRTASAAITTRLDRTCANLESLVSQTQVVPELGSHGRRLVGAAAGIKTFVETVKSAGQLEAPLSVEDFARHRDEAHEILRALSSDCRALLASIALTDREKEVLATIRLIEQARNKADALLATGKKIESWRKCSEAAETVFSTFSGEKKTKIQQIYDDIQGEIDRYYSILHPDESHRDIQLEVAVGRRASTQLRIESFGRRGDPRALASEGHLDSMGLCIFLAFVTKFNRDCPLIALDDVVTTVDARHRESLCRLLHDEFADRQLVVTTHDGVWYEQLCAAQRAYGVQGDYKNLVIVRWSPEAGPALRPYKPRWDTILQRIADGDKSGAGNLGRQHLEWVLETICETVAAPVPFRPSGRYEVRELIDCARRRLRHLVMDDEFAERVNVAFQDLERTVIMGNLLSHDNMLAHAITLEEVSTFCEAVRALHSVFLCPACDKSIRYYRDLRMLRCPNPSCAAPSEVRTR